MTATPAEILRHAEAMLRSGGPAAGVWPRASAFLARQALEAAVDKLWSDRGIDLARASTRARLLCLERYLGDAELAARCRHSWWALSRACHHHPYELAPTVEELTTMLGEVEAVVRATQSGPGLSEGAP